MVSPEQADGQEREARNVTHLKKGALVVFFEHVSRILRHTAQAERMLATHVDTLDERAALALLFVLEVRQEELHLGVNLRNQTLALFAGLATLDVDGALRKEIVLQFARHVWLL